MAYISQDHKREMMPKFKELFRKYGINASISIDNHSSLVVTIRSGVIDFIGNYNETMQNPNNIYNVLHDRFWTPAKDSIDLNPYHYEKHFTGKALDFLTELITIMNEGNHDNSDSSIDYFDVGWYKNVHIGRWNKPYQYVNTGEK